MDTGIHVSERSPLPLFALGNLSSTPAALAALQRRGISPTDYLSRHASGDFGDLDAHDTAANAAAVDSGRRVFSSYNLPACAGDRETKVWIVTEADHRVTTILLPSDY